MNIKSNTELSVEGSELIDRVVLSWLRGALPALPEEGVQESWRIFHFNFCFILSRLSVSLLEI